jgi:formamidopyrimidine-DNA glycosylase
MPELPEVERAAVDLRAWLKGRTIVKARVTDDRILIGKRAAFVRALTGRKVEGVRRRGKQLFVDLADEHALAMHFGMSGKVMLVRDGDEEPKFAKVILELDRDRVVLRDPRILGRACAGTREVVAEAIHWDRLGPDALEIKSGEELLEHVGPTKRAIKVALLDQTRIAGIGNIQATEALWLAKIHPDRTGASLKPREWSALAKGIAESLERSLKDTLEGDLDYLSEGALNSFLVYGRAGEPCPRCKKVLQKEQLAMRTTTFCARCQKRSIAPRSS